MDFCYGIAGLYDDIIVGAARSDAARQLATWLIESHRVQRVLDIACGTGLHARPLAERVVQVVATDASQTMLQEARGKAGDAGQCIEWLHAPMETIAQSTTGPFHAILCLGTRRSGASGGSWRPEMSLSRALQPAALPVFAAILRAHARSSRPPTERVPLR